MGSVKSDLDETLSDFFQIFQILMWYQPYGLKSTNKGVNEETKILKKCLIFMKNILSWRIFSQEFDGINQKSPNPQLRT